MYGRRVEWGRVFFKLGYEFEADRSDGEDPDAPADSGARDCEDVVFIVLGSGVEDLESGIDAGFSGEIIFRICFCFDGEGTMEGEEEAAGESIEEFVLEGRWSFVLGGRR